MLQILPFAKQTSGRIRVRTTAPGPPAALSMSEVTAKAAISMTLHADDEPVRPALFKPVLKLQPA